MIVIKHNEYACIRNPVMTDASGNHVKGHQGYYKNRLGFNQYRTRADHPRPFPLYPGEELVELKEKQVVLRNQSLSITVQEDYTDENGVEHYAGDFIHLDGPIVYVPRNEVLVEKVNDAWSILEGQAIAVEAWRDTEDRNGVQRCAGERYLYTEQGSYLPKIGESFIEIIEPEIITENVALMLESEVDHTDMFGIER